ncbi:MAG TPA: serine hydrolase domain-containing protein [Puia sp.]|nr:serine hydrolase domain-containing protein [Puia sp.]
MRTISALILLLTVNTLYAQPDFKTRLDTFFAGQPANQPGFACSIQKKGSVIYRNAAGLANTRSGTPLDSLTNFRMASVTKQFTAMGILLLEKDGILSVDDPIGRWLPELPASQGQHILIRHLLTHSSGLLDYESLIPPTQTTQVLDTDVLRLLSGNDKTYFPAGSRFQYSNSGYCLLALIIERASKESYPQFIQDRIFAPLHMDNSRVYEKDEPIPHRAMGYARDSSGQIIPSDQSVTSATKGDGGVYTSLSDYAKWINALGRNTLLPLAAALRRLRFPINELHGRYYAAGWFIDLNSPQLLFHSGSTCGFNNFVIQLPGDDTSIVYFSNIADNSDPFKTILKILHQSGYPDLSSVMVLHDQTR